MKNYLFLAFASLLFSSSIFSQKKSSGGAMKYIDRVNMDFSVKPGDNFYEYANGNWLKNNAIPNSQTRWGSFNILTETSSQRLKSISEEAAANPKKNALMQRVGDFYASAMDSAARNKLGFQPIKGRLEDLMNLTTQQQVINEIAIMRTKGEGSPLFGFFVAQDAKNATQYMAQLSQGGTSLPDRDYYLKNDPTSQAVRTAYLSYIKDMFVMTGNTPGVALKKADEILGLETGLAKLQMSRVEMRDPIKRYNKFSVDGLTKITPGLEWKDLLIAMKVPKQDSILVSNPDFLKGVDALLSAVPLDTWKAYLQWSVIKVMIL